MGYFLLGILLLVAFAVRVFTIVFFVLFFSLPFPSADGLADLNSGPVCQWVDDHHVCQDWVS